MHLSPRDAVKCIRRGYAPNRWPQADPSRDWSRSRSGLAIATAAITKPSCTGIDGTQRAACDGDQVSLQTARALWGPSPRSASSRLLSRDVRSFGLEVSLIQFSLLPPPFPAVGIAGGGVVLALARHLQPHVLQRGDHIGEALDRPELDALHQVSRGICVRGSGSNSVHGVFTNSSKTASILFVGGPVVRRPRDHGRPVLPLEAERVGRVGHRCGATASSERSKETRWAIAVTSSAAEARGWAQRASWFRLFPIREICRVRSRSRGPANRPSRPRRICFSASQQCRTLHVCLWRREPAFAICS